MTGLEGAARYPSLTQVEQIVASGPTFINTDASFSVVPEPGVMGLGALALAVFALGKSQRRQA